MVSYLKLPPVVLEEHTAHYKALGYLMRRLPTSGQTCGLWRPLLTEPGSGVSLAPHLSGLVQRPDSVFSAPQPETLG